MKSWVEVSEQRLAANYRLLTEAAGEGTTVLAVVKANAYGHGAAVCAPVLSRAGAEWIGVTDVAEGAAVRAALTSAGISSAMQPEILVMSGLIGDEADAVVLHGLTPVVWDWRQMEWLAGAVRRAGSGAPLSVHVEIDTGMARQGVRPGEDLDELLSWLRAQSALRLDGVMTHFASSEVAGSPQTVKQAGLFEEAMGAVKAAGLEPSWVHAGNSSTVDNQGVENHGEGSPAWLRRLASDVGARSMVRTGLGLYGYCLPIEQGSSISSKGHVIRPSVEPQLQTVMTWKTRVIGLRDVHPGDTVGYNAIFSAQRPMRLALLPVGYADGLRRELSCSDTRPGGWVMVRGRCAPVVGRVSMNLTIVDVTEIPDVAVGDEAIVLGEGITANDHARIADTIAYEIVCGVRASSRLV